MLSPEVITWDDLTYRCWCLYDTIRDDFDYECIISIASGGNYIATELLKWKDVPTTSVRISLYDGQILRPEPIIELKELAYFKGKRVLVVDDIADSGETLRTFKKFFDKDFGEVKFAVLVSKPTAKVQPDYAIYRGASNWVTFPWD